MAGRAVEVILRANASQYKAEMFSAAAATESAMARASRASSRHEALFRASSAALKLGGLGIAGGLAVAVAASANFEARMANVQTLSKATRTEMLALRAGAMHAGTGFGYTANQVADAEAEMVKAGVSVRDMMGGGLKGTLALAAAGQLDVADATTIAASAMTEFKLKGKDVPHIADLLAAGADKSLASVQDLGYGLSQAGTQAHQMGFSIEDTVGTLAEFSQAGLQGERGGTTLKMMLLRLADPSAKAAKLMDQYGLSIYNANGQMKTMPEIAGNLTKSFKDLAPAQRNAALGTIFGSRAIQAANILMAGGEKGNRKWIRSVDDQGFAAQQASGKLANLEGDLTKLKAAGENALIDLGSGSQSPLRGLVQNVTRDINALTKNGDLKRWGNEIGHDLQAVLRDATPLAKTVGGALATVGKDVEHVASAFTKLPKGLQSTLLTGGAVAYGVNKLGLGGLASTLVRGGAAATGLTKGVTPVVVTNWPVGFGASGVPGKGVGAAESAASGAAGSSIGSKFAGVTIATAGLYAAGKGADYLDKHVLHTTLSSKGLTSELEVLGTTGKATGGIAQTFGGDLGKLHNQANMLTAGGLSSVVRGFSDISSVIEPGKQSVEQYRGNMKDLNASFVELAKADPSAALSAWSQVERATGLRTADLAKVMPQAAAAMVKLDNAAQADNLRTLNKALDRNGAAAVGSALSFHAAGLSTQQYASRLDSLPKAVATRVLTPGAITSVADVQALAQVFHLTPKQIRTVMQLVGANAARSQVSKLAQQYNLTPTQVKTLVSEAGANPSAARIRALAQLYRLTPRQVRTLITAVDHASGPSKQAQAAGRAFEKAYKASLNAQDSASPKAKQAKAMAAAFAAARYLAALKANNATGPGVAAAKRALFSVGNRTVTITTIHRDVRVGGGSGVAANPTLNERGGLYDGRVRAFADGGYGTDGAYYSRTPQMVAGGANILWGEKPTGWEAYISGKPSERDRNLEIWRQAGDRLGAQWEEYARGGIREAFASGGHKGKHHKPLTRKQVRAADRAFNLAGGETTADVKSEFGDLRKAFHLGAKALRDMEHSALRLVKAYAANEKVLDKEKHARQNLLSARSEYAGTVTSAYTHDPFGNGLAGLKLQLEADRNDATSALGYSKILDKKHIGQGLQKALLASGDLNTLQQLSGLSGSQVATYSKLYASSTGATSALGNYAGADQYNKAIATQTRLVHAQEALIKKLTSKLDHIEAAVERGARKGTHDGTEGRKRDLHNRHKNGK